MRMANGSCRSPPKDKDNDQPPFQISSRRWMFISRQIEGNYPNWRQVVPDGSGTQTTIEFEADVEAVLQTIQRMPCDDAVNFAIGLEWSGEKVALLARSPGAESWTRIEVAAAKSRGKEVKISSTGTSSLRPFSSASSRSRRSMPCRHCASVTAVAR